ncbi:MAG: thioredoxin [Candidatus Krumholzibacteriia bacterium]
MSNAMPIESASFDTEVLQSKLPVLVDFWAPWCGPCKMLTPTIDALAVEFAGRVKMAKVNVDDNQELAVKYGIRGIPTVMVFKGGKPVSTLVGLRSKDDLARVLNDNL